jgi:hypothetical protein
MRTSRFLWCSGLLLAALGAASPAQIKRYTLDEMVLTSDQAIYGQIIGTRVSRYDSPVDGEGLFFTTITIQGRTLSDDRATTVDVWFRGGFLSATEGVFNSEAPAADDVKLGKKVVAFYRWADDVGNGGGGNALMAAHGGLYRTVDGPHGPAVLGRGDGYAISTNRYVAQLESAVRLPLRQRPWQEPRGGHPASSPRSV